MKVTNIKEFRSILYFVFSDEYEKLKESEKDSIKNEIALSINKIEDANKVLIEQAKSDIEETSNHYYGYSGCKQNRRRIFYIFDIISEKDKKNIVLEYIVNENNIRRYNNFDRYILIPMLDYLSDDIKIDILSKSDSVDLFKFMSELNSIAHNRRYKRNTRKKYAKYYEICQKALQNQK